MMARQAESSAARPWVSSPTSSFLQAADEMKEGRFIKQNREEVGGGEGGSVISECECKRACRNLFAKTSATECSVASHAFETRYPFLDA